MMLYHLCGDTRFNACKFLVALGVPQLVEGHIEHLQSLKDSSLLFQVLHTVV